MELGWNTTQNVSMTLVQVAQYASDLPRASRFYTLLTGRGPSASFDPSGLLFFDLDGVRLLLEAGASPATLYLRVTDLEAELARLAAAGVEVESPPHIIFSHTDDTLGPAGTDEWQAFVRDPDGNLIGLVEWR